MQKDTLMRSVYTICLIYFALVFLEFPTRPLALNCYARHSLSQTTLYFSHDQGYSHRKAYLFRCQWWRMSLFKRWRIIVSLTNSTEDFWNRDLLLVLLCTFPTVLERSYIATIHQVSPWLFYSEEPEPLFSFELVESYRDVWEMRTSGINDGKFIIYFRSSQGRQVLSCIH